MKERKARFIIYILQIKIKFLPAVARYVQESTWHPSQKLAKQRDGSVVAEFQLSTTEEIKKWLLSFGRNAVVLGPKDLCDSMVEEAERLLANYSTVNSRETPSGSRAEHKRERLRTRKASP